MFESGKSLQALLMWFTLNFYQFNTRHPFFKHRRDVISFVLETICPCKVHFKVLLNYFLKTRFSSLLNCFLVYQVGFKTIRFYWSMHSVNRRCKYHCMVEDAEGIPSFTIRVEDDEQKEQLIFRGKSPRGKQSVL